MEGRFDYIIVGAGSAGCVLANRLSANPSLNVLLLEAGGKDNKLEIPIPGAFYRMYQTKVDWDYHSTPQPGLNGRSLFMPRGKTLGGSSSINAMIYIRGHRVDYDSWAEHGCPGWDYDSVLPLFKRSEEFRDHHNPEYHGKDGGLTVSQPNHPSPLSDRFIKAGQEAGIPHNPDFNGPEQEGVGFYHTTIRDGRRCSTAEAFLKPVMSRPNLKVLTGAETQNLIIDDGRVKGVRYRKGRKQAEAYAQAEVILSAGAIGTPHILLKSGIGPAQELKDKGVEVVLDSAGVGLNLQDHLFAPVVVSNLERNSMDPIDRPTHILQHLFKFFFSSSGPLTSNLAEAGGFVKSHPALPAPNIQFIFAPCYFVDHGFVRPKGHGISVCSTLLHPASRGSIRLRKGNPTAYPEIDPGHYREDIDMEHMKAGVRLVQKILNTKALSGNVGSWYSPSQPWSDDSELEQWIRNTSEALYHPVGTCKMGQDELSVVDPELRLRGLSGLRIADASVMPTIVRGNTNAPTIMIGEKAADLILGSPADQSRVSLKQTADAASL